MHMAELLAVFLNAAEYTWHAVYSKSVAAQCGYIIMFKHANSLSVMTAISLYLSIPCDSSPHISRVDEKIDKMKIKSQ